MLPSPSPQFTATAMWGPLLGWCALELLAESIDAENPERMALDLFDRLRLREPFAQAFSALGFEGEEGWRVAARIKVVLLSEAGVGNRARQRPPAWPASKPKRRPLLPNPLTPGAAGVGQRPEAAKDPDATATAAEPSYGERVALAPSLWLDPDVRWLTGAHEAAGPLLPGS